MKKVIIVFSFLCVYINCLCKPYVFVKNNNKWEKEYYNDLDSNIVAKTLSDKKGFFALISESFGEDPCVVVYNIFNQEPLMIAMACDTIAMQYEQVIRKDIHNYHNSHYHIMCLILGKDIITQKFIEESLNINSSNETIEDKRNKITYYFDKGKLHKFRPNNLNSSGLFLFQNCYDIYEVIFNNGCEIYKYDIDLVSRYVNLQAEYFRGLTVEEHLIIPLEDEDSWNFVLWYSIIKGKDVNLTDFLFTTPNARIIQKIGDLKVVQYKDYIFNFRSNKLIK